MKIAKLALQNDTNKQINSPDHRFHPSIPAHPRVLFFPKRKKKYWLTFNSFFNFLRIGCFPLCCDKHNAKCKSYLFTTQRAFSVTKTSVVTDQRCARSSLDTCISKSFKQHTKNHCFKNNIYWNYINRIQLAVHLHSRGSFVSIWSGWSRWSLGSIERQSKFKF